jgi:hypothetical protein
MKVKMRQALPGNPTSQDQHHESETRLHGRWLVLAWIICIIMIIFTFVVFFGSLPVYFVLLQTICAGSTCIAGQPAPDTEQTLQGMGLSLASYAMLTIILTSTTQAFAAVIAALLVWRKPDDWMTLLVALMLVMICPVNMMYALLQRPTLWQVPALLLNILAFDLFFLVVSLMPDGKFVPKWTRWLAVSWLAWGLIAILFLKVPDAGLLTNLVWIAELMCLVIALIYRYTHISSPVQRQQTKWVVYGWSTSIAVAIMCNLPAQLWPILDRPGSPYDLALAIVNIFVLLPGILSIAFAIIRYHLWDIDILINRTLVYGILTALLALVYAGLVIGLQFLLRGIIGQTNDVAIVISTLAVAALFQPLRRSIQNIIDRRFYRRKYDAASTLEAFSATLRHEVDLATLNEHLMAVVQETMQPTHVSLWVRKNPQEGKHIPNM